jgi:hypothetical protein
MKKVLDFVKGLWTPQVKAAAIRGLRVLVFGIAAVLVADLANLDPIKASVIGTALIAVVDKFVRAELAK